MARGSQAKQEILEKLKETFPNSFMEDAKILRIPWQENGETVEIKIQMTAAKNLLGGEQTKPTAPKSKVNLVAPSAEEKAEVEAMIRALGGRIHQQMLMKEIYKMAEWQDTVSGTWHCNDVSHGYKYAVWWVVPRLLDITPAKYIELLIKSYNAEVDYSVEKNVLLIQWQKQADMRRFKNTINRIAREKNFYIDDQLLVKNI